MCRVSIRDPMPNRGWGPLRCCLRLSIALIQPFPRVRTSPNFTGPYRYSESQPLQRPPT